MDAEDGEQLRITFEDYRKISNVLILHMREFEEKNKGYHFTDLTPIYDKCLMMNPMTNNIFLTYGLSIMNLMFQLSQVQWLPPYRNHLNFSVKHLHKSSDNEEGALKKKELVDWYITQIEDEIEGEQEMIAKMNIAEKVIERLVKVVGHLTCYDLYMNAQFRSKRSGVALNEINSR